MFVGIGRSATVVGCASTAPEDRRSKQSELVDQGGDTAIGDAGLAFLLGLAAVP